MFVAICAALGECVMEQRKSKIGTVKVKAKRDTNGRLVRVDDDLVQIGGAKETVRVKASSRHGIGTGNLAGAGLGVHHLVKDASGRLVVCDNIGSVLRGNLGGKKIHSIDIDGRVQLWRGNGVCSVSFGIIMEPRAFLEGLLQYPNCTRVEVARIYPSFKSTKFTATCSLDKLSSNWFSHDTWGMILYFSRDREVSYNLTAMVIFMDRILTLTGDNDYVAALVHWLSAR